MDLLNVKKIDLSTYGLPILVILSSVLVATSSLTKTNPEVTALLAYDLVILSPLFYFLLIRKRKISNLTVIPVIIIGIVLANILLPENQHGHLNLVKIIAFSVIEIYLIFTILRKAYLLSISIKTNAQATDDAYTIIKKSCIASFGNNAFIKFLITEMAAVYYGLITWKKKILIENEFTNYKDNGTLPLLCGLIFVMGIETGALHVLIAKWSSIVAWILTVLSIYTIFLVFSHIKALSRRPSIINDNFIFLKNGLVASIEIDIVHIRNVELFANENLNPDGLVGNLGPSKESKNHNVVIYFSEMQTVEKFYGQTQECDTLLFYIDNKHNFVQKLKDLIA